ncbi:MAG: TlpA family protein disulfide reductase [Planctomycetaceae bacterium]
MIRVSLICFLVAAFASVTCYGDDRNGTLYWANGDVLPGRLMQTEGDQLRWKSPLFQEPLLVKTSVLADVRFDQDNEILITDEAFRLTTRSGNVLHGSLTEISENLVRFECKRHGTVMVDRSQIRSLRRLDNPSLIYLGPAGLNGWKTLSSKRKLTEWKVTDEGYLTTVSDKAQLFRKLDIPGRAEIELVLGSTGQMQFHLGLNSKVEDDVHLETWDDTLVALFEEEFVEIQQIPQGTKQLTLRIYWDESTQQLAVYSEAGAELGTIKGGKKKGSGDSGIYLENHGPGLTVRSLRVSHWDGSKPKAVEKGQNRIHLTDGSIVYGRITALESDTIRLVKGDDEEANIPIDKIDSIYLAEDIKSIRDGTTNVFWLDGTRITGELTEIREGRIGLKTNYSPEPIISTLDKSNRLQFTPAKAAELKGEAAPDRLYCSGGTLHGTLVGNGDDTGNAALRWKPFGGVNSSPLAADCDARFVRGKRTTEITYDKTKFGDLLYLVSGDIVPCHIDSIDSDSLHITTAFANAKKIPHDNVKAIELASTGTLEASDFGDPDWRISGSTKNIKKQDDKVVFTGTGRITNKNAFSGGAAVFNVKWDPQSYVALNLRVFGTGSGATGGTNIVIYMRQNTVWATQSNQFRGRTRSIPVSDTDAKMKLEFKDQRLIVSVDGKELHKTGKLKPKGSGMTFQVTQNQLFRRNIGGNNKSTFTVSQFESRRGTAVRQFVDSEAKERALTTPRFRRDKPPTHVVIAPNGDLLRGKLQMVTPKQVRFSSRLEDFRFDRERISAIIWLHPEGEKEQPKPDAAAPIVRTVLDGGLGLVLIPERMTDDQLIGRSPVLGECAVPVSAIRELFAGKYEKKGEKFAYADWSLTPGMEPRWDMEDAGGGDPAMKLVGTKATNFKLASVKGDAFELKNQQGKIIVLDFWATWCGPCVRAMPEYLAAIKELPQDKVQFVAVNQGQTLKEVTDFLELREWDIPKVIMDEDMQVAQMFKVSGIPHTVVIGQDGTVEWVHTGFSPGGGETLKANIEQMIAGTWEREKPAGQTINGTDSKLVGSDAKDFEMKLLDGRDFKLSDAKGDVIILDFWATWCGPCVRALPDYLEVMKELDSKGVRFIAVNQEESKDRIKKFLESRELKMTVGLDPNSKIGDLFNVESIPQTVVIGPDGKIEWLHVGYKTGVADALKETVKRLLPQKAE